MTDKEVKLLQRLIVILGKKEETIEGMSFVDIMWELCEIIESK